MLADGRRALSGSGDKTLRLWDLEIGAELRRFEDMRAEISTVAVLADGRRACRILDRTLRLSGSRDECRAALLQGHEDWIRSATVLADDDASCLHPTDRPAVGSRNRRRAAPPSGT